MDDLLKKYSHAPAHMFVDNAVYFVTGATYLKKMLLASREAKEIFIKKLYHFCEKYSWDLLEWVILDNHYHFLAKISNSTLMPIAVNTLHKTSAYYIKREMNISINRFWYQYWDHCIRNEKEYYTTANYILYNPIKHNYVKDLKEYPFSSFHIRLEEDEEKLRSRFLNYDPQKLSTYEDYDDF